MAAYAICVRGGQLLLARSPGPDGTLEWVLPGGGMDHGEDPYDTVRREVTEETGYEVEPTALLGLHSSHRTFSAARFRRAVDHHGVRLVYEARITGGELRHEIGGSTDMAAWHPLDEVTGLTRIRMVDVGLRLWRERPPVGHVEPSGE